MIQLPKNEIGGFTCRRYFDVQVSKNIQYSEYNIKYELELLPICCVYYDLFSFPYIGFCSHPSPYIWSYYWLNSVINLVSSYLRLTIRNPLIYADTTLMSLNMNIGMRPFHMQYWDRPMMLRPPSLKHKPMRLKAKFTLTIYNQPTCLLTSGSTHNATTPSLRHKSMKLKTKFTLTIYNQLTYLLTPGSTHNTTTP